MTCKEPNPAPNGQLPPRGSPPLPTTDKLTVAEAQFRIARIMEQLERDTNQLVESVDIRDLDVTTVGHDRVHLHRCVEILMRRLPGTEWST